MNLEFVDSLALAAAGGGLGYFLATTINGWLNRRRITPSGDYGSFGLNVMCEIDSPDNRADALEASIKKAIEKFCEDQKERINDPEDKSKYIVIKMVGLTLENKDDADKLCSSTDTP